MILSLDQRIFLTPLKYWIDDRFLITPTDVNRILINKYRELGFGELKEVNLHLKNTLPFNFKWLKRDASLNSTTDIKSLIENVFKYQRYLIGWERWYRLSPKTNNICKKDIVAYCSLDLKYVQNKGINIYRNLNKSLPLKRILIFWLTLLKHELVSVEVYNEWLSEQENKYFETLRESVYAK